MDNKLDGFFSDIYKTILDSTEMKTYLGDVELNKLSLPSIQVIPDTTNRTDNQEYDNRIRLFYYFERDRRTNKYLEHLRDMENSIANILSALDGKNGVINYQLESIIHYSGETENTLLEVVECELKVTKLMDFTKFKN